jgi:hypothetical protein
MYVFAFFVYVCFLFFVVLRCFSEVVASLYVSPRTLELSINKVFGRVLRLSYCCRNQCHCFSKEGLFSRLLTVV